MDESLVRRQLVALLRGRDAHMPFEEAVARFPVEAMNRRAPNEPYTPWHLLEHVRIAQRDILDFIRDPDYQSPPWPEGYWPARDAMVDWEGWNRTVEAIRSDRAALEAIVLDPNTDLTAALPAGEKYTVLREILVVSDHNAYHLGEFGAFREIMGTWQRP